MPNRLEFYFPYIYFLAAFIYAWLGLIAWRKRPVIAASPFAWTMLGMSIWSALSGLGIFAPTLASKLILKNIEYFSIVSIPVLLFIFSLEFIGKSHLLKKRWHLLLWSIPVLIVFLVWTNKYHHLMWDMESISRIRGLAILNLRYGTFFWIQNIYATILVLMASLLLIIEMVQRPGVYRIQVSLIVIGILAPWAVSLIFIRIASPINDLDFTPLFFLPTGLGLSWAITRSSLLEIMPLEHLNVLKNMTDGVIVINQNRRVLYINPLIEEILDCSEAKVLGQPLSYISKKYGGLIAASIHQSEIVIGEGKQARVFEVNMAPVASQNNSGNQTGPDSMLTLHDITDRKKAETAISRREIMMSAISLAAEQFLKESQWENNISGVLKKIGEAANVSRVYVTMNYTGEDGLVYSSLCYEWAGPDIVPQINNPALRHVPLRKYASGRWENMLSEGHPIFGIVRDFPKEEWMFFQTDESISMAAMPIFVGNQWWGFIMLDECRNERHWTSSELEALYITASLFGSAEARARTEQKLIRGQRTLNLLHEIVTISLQAESAIHMTQTVVDRLGKLINADGCFLSLWDEANKQTIPFAAYGPFKETYASLSPQPGENTFTQSVLNLGKTLVIEDTRITDYADQRIIKSFPSISILALPLMVKNRKLGSVLLTFNKLHRFLPEEIEISEQATALIALALEKFQAVEHAHKRANTSEILRKANAAITETLEIDETVDRILEHLKQVTHYTTASVQLLKGDELEIIGGSGFDETNSVVGIRFPVPGNNPNTIVIETGKPYLLPEIGDVYSEFKKAPHNHIHSWLGVPLIFQDRVIGLLAIDSATPNQFTQENIDLAVAFADQVSAALENSRIYENAQSQAITDPLTGVYNRRGLFELARVDFIRSVSLERPFSGIMIDLDHFKQINDTYGHSTGDQILRELAKRCKSCVREIDFVGRYGGEEFIIILPETNLATGKIVAERLRASIGGKPMITAEGLELNVTASLGVAQRDEYTTNLEMLITRADQAMYVAKHKGRNQVAVSS